MRILNPNLTRLFVAIVATVLFAISASARPYRFPLKPFNTEGITMVRWMQVSPNLFRASQPQTSADFQQIKQNGINVIINLRDDTTVPESEKRAKENGIEFVNYPLNPEEEDYGPKVLDALHLISSNPTKKFLIHCREGKDRTGLVAAMYRVQDQGWTPEDAYKEWVANGLDTHWKYIQKYFWQTVEPGAACAAKF